MAPSWFSCWVAGLAETIYHGGAGGHGEDHAQAYVIEVAEAGAASAEAEPEVDFAAVMASADARGW